MNNTPLISIILIARNDNYGGFFKRRLQLCINYFVRNFQRFPSSRGVEIIVLDWNSQTPLSADLPLSAEAQQVVRFLSVPPEIAARYNPDGMEFHTTLATNAAIERARGQYFMLMPGDILFTVYALERLWAVLEGRLPLCFDPLQTVMTIKRKIVPMSLRETERDYETLDRYLSLAHNALAENFINPGISADVGAVLCSREIWREVGGFDETMFGWGKSDSRFGLSASARHPVYELDGLGVYCYDPAIDASNLKQKKKLKNAVQPVYARPACARPGIPDELLLEAAGALRLESPATAAPLKPFTSTQLQTLFTLGAREVAAPLPFHALRLSSGLFPLYWFLRNRPVHCFCETVSPAADRPDWLPDFALYDECAPALVSALSPAAELLAIFPESSPGSGSNDHRLIGRQYLNKKSGELRFAECLLRELFPPYPYAHKWHPGFTCATHHGLAHYLTGSPDTAFSRLCTRLPAQNKIDLLVFRPAVFQNPREALNAALPLLRPGALVIIEDPALQLLPLLAGDPTLPGTFVSDESLRLGLYFPDKEPQVEALWEQHPGLRQRHWRPRPLPIHYALTSIFALALWLRRP